MTDPDDYDSPWKEALDAYFRPFLALFLPAAHAEIDWSRGSELLDHELRQVVPKAALGKRRVDHLVKVWLNSGQERWVLVHVEVQTSWDRDFARRMYTYNYRPFDKYNNNVASLAVLGDDNPRWRPNQIWFTRWGTQTGIRFPVVKLLAYRERWETLQESRNPFAMVVLAHWIARRRREDLHARYAAKIKLIKGLYERGWAAEELRRIFRVIDWMVNLPKPLEVDFAHEINQYEEERHMPYITTPERIGREEGRAEGLQRAIELALEPKFGEAGLRLMPEIRAITDAQKLEAVLQAIFAAARPEDMRRVWSG
jgi:hypothetical protein